MACAECTEAHWHAGKRLKAAALVKGVWKKKGWTGPVMSQEHPFPGQDWGWEWGWAARAVQGIGSSLVTQNAISPNAQPIISQCHSVI